MMQRLVVSGRVSKHPDGDLKSIRTDHLIMGSEYGIRIPGKVGATAQRNKRGYLWPFMDAIEVGDDQVRT
uniref:hypothetical protein n=1 Tax=uncultured Ruegeria sp. TaxID=259304 RepID=UPI00262946AE